MLQHYGYVAVFVVPMIECAGVPVPGETILLAAAVYAATTGRLNIVGVIAAAAGGAIVGGNLGYLGGMRGGRALALRYGRFIHLGEKQLRLGERFFARHGDGTVFIARFVTVLRPIGAFLAGAARMRYRDFFAYNAAGGVAWAVFYGVLAYGLGGQFDRYRLLIARSGVVLAGVGLLLVALFVVFGRQRFERWALGEADPVGGVAP